MTAMEASFPGRSAQPAGRFKVGMPQSLARHCVLPRIGEFLQQYPDTELILCSSDNVEDIIREGFDCVIRTGQIEDSTTTVARPLARYRWMVLASPARIAAHGRPQSIDDLHQHRAVGYLNHRTGRTIDWLFSLDDGDCAIRMRETLVVDDTDAYIRAGVQGLGLIRVASYLAQPGCRAARWSPVWSRPRLIFPCRWSIRKTAICRRRCARFTTGAGAFCNPRSARPDDGASARLLAAHGLFYPRYQPVQRRILRPAFVAQYTQGKFRVGHRRASARSAYCACQRCASPGTVAKSGRVVSRRKGGEILRGEAHAPRESLTGELAIYFPWPVSR